MRSIQKLIAVLFLFVSTNLICQVYKPMLDFKNEWQVTNCGSGCNSNTYFTDGDTIVDTMSYKILDGFHYISRTFLLRENQNNRKVYLLKLDPVKNTEFLLYDFSLQVGDTMELFNPFSPIALEAGFFQLDSIKLKLLYDGNMYRHFYLSPTSSNTQSSESTIWIEGMGATALTNVTSRTLDYNGIGAITCFFKNSDLFYSLTDSVPSCIQDYPLGIESYNAVPNHFKLYPNPASTRFQFDNYLEIESVIIFDFLGKKIYQSQDITENILISPNMEKGIYRVLIHSKNGGLYQQNLFIE